MTKEMTMKELIEVCDKYNPEDALTRGFVHLQLNDRHLVTTYYSSTFVNADNAKIECIDYDKATFFEINKDNVANVRVMTADELPKVRPMSIKNFVAEILSKNKDIKVSKDNRMITIHDMMNTYSIAHYADAFRISLVELFLERANEGCGVNKRMPEFLFVKDGRKVKRVMVMHPRLYNYVDDFKSLYNQPIQCMDEHGACYNIYDINTIKDFKFREDMKFENIEENASRNMILDKLHALDVPYGMLIYEYGVIFDDGLTMYYSNIAEAMGYRVIKNEDNIGCLEYMDATKEHYSIEPCDNNVHHRALILSHNDSDGVMAAAIIANYATRYLDCKCEIIMEGSPKEEATSRMIDEAHYNYDHVFVLDREASFDSLTYNRGKRTVYIDHHIANIESLLNDCDYEDIDIETTTFKKDIETFEIYDDCSVFYSDTFSASMIALEYVNSKVDFNMNLEHKDFLNEVIRVDLWDTFKFKEVKTEKQFRERYEDTSLYSHAYNFEIEKLCDERTVVSGNLAFNKIDNKGMLDGYIHCSLVSTPFALDTTFIDIVYDIEMKKIDSHVDSLIRDIRHTETTKDELNVIVASKYADDVSVAMIFDILNDRLLCDDENLKDNTAVIFRKSPYSEIMQVRANRSVVNACIELGGGGHPKACGYRHCAFIDIDANDNSINPARYEALVRNDIVDRFKQAYYM